MTGWTFTRRVELMLKRTGLRFTRLSRGACFPESRRASVLLLRWGGEWVNLVGAGFLFHNGRKKEVTLCEAFDGRANRREAIQVTYKRCRARGSRFSLVATSLPTATVPGAFFLLCPEILAPNRTCFVSLPAASAVIDWIHLNWSSSSKNREILRLHSILLWTSHLCSWKATRLTGSLTPCTYAYDEDRTLLIRPIFCGPIQYIRFHQIGLFKPPTKSIFHKNYCYIHNGIHLFVLSILSQKLRANDWKKILSKRLPTFERNRNFSASNSHESDKA
jgi:hypothetical protein